jgi:hypothetical protein
MDPAVKNPGLQGTTHEAYTQLQAGGEILFAGAPQPWWDRLERIKEGPFGSSSKASLAFWSKP